MDDQTEVFNKVSNSNVISGSSTREVAKKQDIITQITVQIIQNSLFSLNNPDKSLIQQLEFDLIQLMNRGSIQTLMVSVPCLCQVINLISKDHQRLSKIVNSCVSLLEKALSFIATQPKELPRNLVPTAMRSLLIMGNMVRHLKSPLKDTPSSNKIMELLFDFCRVERAEKISLVAVAALGQAMIKHTNFIMKEQVRSFLVNLHSNSHMMQVELLRLVYEFVNAHDVQPVKQEKPVAHMSSKHASTSLVDTRVLIGNAEELGEAGISSALIQIHLTFILDSLFSQHSQIFTCAFKLFLLVLDQGLVHPILVIFS